MLQANEEACPSASMRVRFATQVLSHLVAVGIKTLADIKGLTGQHQQNFLAAARFCENFNGLFDCFNSKELKDSHKLKCAISDASAHFPFFDNCLEWLPRLKLVGANSSKKQIPCVEGWQHMESHGGNSEKTLAGLRVGMLSNVLALLLQHGI